jgi:hypothetical protein
MYKVKNQVNEEISIIVNNKTITIKPGKEVTIDKEIKPIEGLLIKKIEEKAAKQREETKKGGK